jgi:hypothetical protein
MVEPQTVSEVLKRLAQEGFTEDFKAHKSKLRGLTSNILVSPDDVVVEKIYRFEGETDLNDEEIIFALNCPSHAVKGTYLVAFGGMMDPKDADIVSRLEKKVNKNK